MAITNDEFCLTVMEDLATVGGANANALANRTVTGFIDALQSPLNRNGTEIEAMYAPGDGKTHKALVKYFKPDSYADFTDEITNICDDTGTESSYVYDEVTLTLEAQSPVKKLTWAQMRTLCESGQEFQRAKLIGGMLDAARKYLNRQLVQQYENGAGGILSGNGGLNIGYNMLFQDADGLLSVDPIGQINLMRNLADIGMVGAPIVVGGHDFYTFAKLTDISCCNLRGIDPSMMPEMAYFYDNDMDGLLSTPSNGSPFFVFSPGAAQFVSKPLYVDQFRRVNDQEIFDTIVDPVLGVTWDFRAVWDGCDEFWKMKLSLRHDLWQLPLDMFKSTDPRFKVNFNILGNLLTTEAA